MKCFALLALCVAATYAEDYVDYLGCFPTHMVFHLKNDSSLADATFNAGRLSALTSPLTNYSVVGGCGKILPLNVTPADFTFNFTECHVELIQPAGGDGYAYLPLQVATLVEPIRKFTFSLHCDYPSTVTQDSGTNVTVPSGSGGGSDHGGGAGSDVEGLTSGWFDQNDKPIGENYVAVNSKISYRITYTKDFYQRFMPMDCFMADMKNPSETTRKIPFVKGSCPSAYSNWIGYDLEAKKYQIDIDAIQFDADKTVLYAWCNLRLCIDASDEDCIPDTSPDCWDNTTANHHVTLNTEMEMAELVMLAGQSKSGTVWASVSVGAPANGGGGNASTATILGATLGTVAGILVIGLVVLLVLFASRRKAPVEPAVESAAPAGDPAWANNWWLYYKIPRAKSSAPGSSASSETASTY